MKTQRGIAPFRFKPYSPKAKKLLTWWLPPSSYRDHDGIIADGSIRSAKTITMIDGFIEWSRQNFRNQNFIISGKSAGALKRNVISPMRQILASKGINPAYNRSEGFLAFGSNTYYFFGANNEASQDVLQGITAAGWYGDEVALQPQSFIEQAIGRCSVQGSKIWLNCNPESPFHYVKTELIDKAASKRLLHMHFTLDDNLTLSEQIKDRYKRMFAGVWYDRFIMGEWKAAEGAVYGMFDAKEYVVDSLPNMVQHWVGVDYGTSNPTIYLLMGRGADDKLYIIDEWRYDSAEHYGKQKTDAEYSRSFQVWIMGHKVQPRFIFVDPSAASFITQLHRDGVRNLASADNRVLDGIRYVGSLFSCRRLLIHRRCEGLIREISGYSWDPKAQERGEDAPIKKADHGPDALRYLINSTANVWQGWINH
jgi:PBSX family phage terminase large subunit